MKRISQISMVALLLCLLPMLSVVSEAAMDHEKLLKDPGVYATFAVFKMGEHWWQMDHEARVKAASEMKKVFEKHADKLIVDTHLLRGLSERADVLVRIHSKEMVHNQNFLLDLMGTTMGMDMKNTDTFNGITKTLNYVPSFPEELKGGAPGGSSHARDAPVGSHCGPRPHCRHGRPQYCSRIDPVSSASGRSWRQRRHQPAADHAAAPGRHPGCAKGARPGVRKRIAL